MFSQFYWLRLPLPSSVRFFLALLHFIVWLILMATKLLDATPSYEYNRAHIFFVLGNAAITTEWEWNEEHQYSVLLLFFLPLLSMNSDLMNILISLHLMRRFKAAM